MNTSAWTIEPRRAQVLARVVDYVELTKPRISALVLVTVAVAGLVARWGQPDLTRLAHVLLGTALVAASASAINQWLERQRDALMERTADRPLPAGRLSGAEVLTVGCVTVLAGVGYLVMTVGWVTGLLGAVTWLLYTAVYTPLKTRTHWNTAVGAVDGAMPVAADGTFLTSFGEEGAGPGWIKFAMAVAVTDDGEVFVADFGNNRIQKWRPRDG